MEIVLEEGREAAREHQAQDPAIKLGFHWVDADKNGTQTSPGKREENSSYCSRRGCAGTLVCAGTTRIGRGSSLRKNVLEQLHNSKMSRRHFTFQKTLDRARKRFWWPKMREDIERKCEK